MQIAVPFGRASAWAAARAADAVRQLASQVAVNLADVPNPAPAQPPGTGGITTIMSWVKWIGFIVCAIALVSALIIYAIQSHRGDGGQGMSDIVKILLIVVFIGAAFGLVGALVS